MARHIPHDPGDFAAVRAICRAPTRVRTKPSPRRAATLRALAGSLALSVMVFAPAPRALAQSVAKPQDSAPSQEKSKAPAPPTIRKVDEADKADDAPQPEDLPDLDESVQAFLDADYLTDAERAALRTEHGVPTEADLALAPLAAKAALIRGAWDDPSLRDAPTLDHAEALLNQGDPKGALTLLQPLVQTVLQPHAQPAPQPAQKDSAPLRAMRLAAQANLDLGNAQAAETILRALTPLLRDPELKDAAELSEGVRAALLLSRLIGAEHKDAIGYQELLTLVARGRDELDGLSWRVYLAEALVLFEKDMYQECASALEGALTRNPRSVEAWSLLGMIKALTFDPSGAERVALRIDDLAGPACPQAALIRAQAQLRLGEGALAEQALAPALQKYPANRELLASRAASAAVAFDFARADTLCKEFDALAPRSPQAYLAIGKAVSSIRQYEEAARYLGVASDRAPTWADPSVELGLLELQAGRLPQARAALDRALLLDRFNARAKNSQALLSELETYASVEGEHFIVRYKPGEDEAMAREMLPVLERIYTRVTGNAPGGIDHKPAGKTVVELYPNHRWFATRIIGMPSLHTFAAATGPVIAMETPRSGPGHLVGPYDWARVVQHEYTHTVTLSRTKNRLPHWFTEAGAVYLEDAPRDEATARLLLHAWETQSLFDFDTINIMFTRPRKQTDRGQAYSQGAWMYEYIISRFGQHAPLDLMDLYAQGVREPEAFERVLGLSRAKFLDDFTDWAQQQLTAWGYVAPEGRTSLEDLLLKEGVQTPTPELLTHWLAQSPGHPELLEALSELIARRDKATWTTQDLETLSAYAAARPFDALPHRELAAFFLSANATPLGKSAADAVPHLQWLDAREQNSPSYAAELARQFAAQEQWKPAMEKVTRATQLAPYDATIRELAATIALRAGDPATAERHIWALTLLEPDRAIHKQRLEAVRARLSQQAPQTNPPPTPK